MVRGVHKIYLSAILDLYDRRIQVSCQGWVAVGASILPAYPCRHLLAFCIRQVAAHLDKVFQPLADILPLKLFLIPQVILAIVKDAESLTVKIDEATSTISKRPRETADAVLFFEESYGFLFRFLLLEMVIDAVLAAPKTLPLVMMTFTSSSVM